MRLAVLLGCAVLAVACTKKEGPPAADTTAAAVPAEPPAVSLGHLAGIWNVTAKPAGKSASINTLMPLAAQVTGNTNASAAPITYIEM